jgi:putative sigma-54 modulation protein
MPTIVVTGRDAQVSSRNKERAEEKISKLEKYFDRIGKIEVLLGHAGDNAEVELVISIKRSNPIVCHSRAKDLYTAIDLVLDKAEAQLTKRKEKLKTHKGEPSAAGARDAAQAGAGDEEALESYDEVIEKREFP